MFKYAVNFSKKGKTRFIGHLDLLRLFQRAINRAALPVARSTGFNPHQLITFALPLPLGMEGENERADIRAERFVDEIDMKNRLNRVMPEGIVISRCRAVSENEQAVRVTASLYEITFKDAFADMRATINETLCADELLVLKKTKKNAAVTNIRPDIISLSAISDYAVTALLSAGGERNLKPSLLAAYMAQRRGADEFDPLSATYKRIAIYSEVKDHNDSSLARRFLRL
ncbi:MAG: TIGR03936 family radical SAM-associated protein [Clostridiales bacterium]|nr:TIGR03936 family radical SAM-associated protein [Clostridiales bacterium]